jgi:hypothetical protein
MKITENRQKFATKTKNRSNRPRLMKNRMRKLREFAMNARRENSIKICYYCDQKINSLHLCNKSEKIIDTKSSDLHKRTQNNCNQCNSVTHFNQYSKCEQLDHIVENSINDSNHIQSNECDNLIDQNQSQSNDYNNIINQQQSQSKVSQKHEQELQLNENARTNITFVIEQCKRCVSLTEEIEIWRQKCKKLEKQLERSICVQVVRL